MGERSEKLEASSSGSNDRPKVFTALHRDPKYRKANAEFLTRRLRLEFDKLTTARPLCRGASSIPPLPPELQKYRKFNFRSTAKKSRKRSNFSMENFQLLSISYIQYCYFHIAFRFQRISIVHKNA